MMNKTRTLTELLLLMVCIGAATVVGSAAAAEGDPPESAGAGRVSPDGQPAAPSSSWTQRAKQVNREVLTADDLGKLSLGEPPNRRGKIVLRRIDPADPHIDWNADPTAIPYVTYQFEQRTGLPTYTNNDGLNVATDELFEYPLVYLTGHSGWQFNEEEADNMTKFVERGGTVFLDDCYVRRSTFTDSVGPESSKMVPGAELRQVIWHDEYTSDLFTLCYSFPPAGWPGQAKMFGNLGSNFWQYVLHDGRPAIFFTPNDDGCAWEVSSPPTASNPIGEGIGHGGSNEDREKCYQWMTDWFLFALTH